MHDTDLHIHCKVEVKGPVVMGQPMPVVARLFNAGTQAVWLLTSSTFMAESNHCLALMRESRVLLDRDIATPDISDAGGEDYIRVEPGASLSREMDLADRYDIAAPGAYKLALRMAVYGAIELAPRVRPGDRADHKLRFVESDPIALVIQGSAAQSSTPSALSLAAAKPVRVYPEQPMRPLFLGMQPEQRDAWMQAHTWAYRSILAAIESAKQPALFDYTRWMEYFDSAAFAKDDAFEQRRLLVVNNLVKMANRMAFTQVTYEKCSDGACNDTLFSALGWTRPNSAESIRLCWPAFSDNYLRTWSTRAAPWGRAFIVVHEMSHNAAGTEDSRYVMSECDRLATFEPNLAVRNAQNYAYFVMYDAATPPDVQAGKGMWEVKPVPVPWRVSPAGVAAAALPNEGVLLIVYQDVASVMDGILWCKPLLTASGRWMEGQQMKLAGEVQPCKSHYLDDRPQRPTPALVAYRQGGTNVFSCLYVERQTRELVLVQHQWPIGPNPAAAFADDAPILWRRVMGNLKLFPAPHATLGTTAVWFEDKLWCIYVTGSGDMVCLRGSDGVFENVPLVTPAVRTKATPTLAVFEDRLVCIYQHPGGTRQVLFYAAGVWSVDAMFPLLETSALVQWNRPEGPRLLAIGRTAGKGTLSYVISKGDASTLKPSSTFWHTRVTLEDGGPHGAALAASPGAVHAFYQRDDERLEHMIITEARAVGP